MPHRYQVLTPEALAMMDAIARTGSFAAAARELGKVPSALTYNVRQLEEALDVLLFDRSSRQAQLTAAGQELLLEGRRLLQEMQAVANRVRRVASGWEATLSISVEDILSWGVVFDLVDEFYAMQTDVHGQGPATRVKLRSDVLTGTWEALVSGEADLAMGVVGDHSNPGGIEMRPMGEVPFVFCVAPHHRLALECPADGVIDHDRLVHHRAVAVADSARRMPAMTRNLLPGQDVLTVPSMRSKLVALRRGLGVGYLPLPMVQADLDAGHLQVRQTASAAPIATLFVAWRSEHGRASLGRALLWWLDKLNTPATLHALLHSHHVPTR